MRWSRPRFTIANLMVLVVIASLVSTGIVLHLERNRRAAALQIAVANYENAMLTRQVAEIAVVEYTDALNRFDINEAMEYRRELSDSNDRAVELATPKRAQRNEWELQKDHEARMALELKREVKAKMAAEQAAKAAYDQINAAKAKPWW